jgi:Transposase DDE domain
VIIGEGLPFIRDYVSAINTAIKQQDPEKSLTRIQSCWLSFVILGLLVTNSLCWKRFEKFSIGRYSTAGLSWMFCKARIAWEVMLQASIIHLFSAYGIKSGTLVLDDSDKERSKNTTEIAKVHKIKNKKGGGYFNGQNLIFLVLVSETLTVPVGFCFYEPDPKMTAWRKEEKRLKEKEVAKCYRQPMPAEDPNYPGKKALALKLLSGFMKLFPTIRIKAVAVDMFYGTKDFIDEAEKITGQKQIISQIKKTQLINVNGRNVAIGEFFKNYHGKTEQVILRGSGKTLTYRSGKFKVKSHGKKYYIVALKYEDEEEYRYLIANDMSWRDVDIIKAYSLRWLVEVFIQDWKSYEGWNQLAKQRGEEGSDHGVILSLLCDHALLLHQDQKALFENKQPAITVGSLREKVMMESLSAFIEGIVSSDDPKAMFEEYSDKISELFELRSSVKHMRGIDMSFGNA